mgnify:CR=1 FL=1
MREQRNGEKKQTTLSQNPDVEQQESVIKSVLNEQPHQESLCSKQEESATDSMLIEEPQHDLEA